MKKYKSIFISDVHLGARDCKADELLDFLNKNSSENLFLVGDIIDAWKMQKNSLKWRKSHTNVIRKILKLSTKGTRVVYIAGNHDEFLRPFMMYVNRLGNLEIANQVEHYGIDGNRYLVVHGDLFDGITRLAPWLSFLGDSAYTFVLNLNTKFNWIRHKMGFGYWSLSKYLKTKVKKSIDFIFQFEKNLAQYCRKRGYDGIICGHIHHAEIKNIDGVVYMNDGDFVESISALVETHAGDWILIHLDESKWRPFQVLDRQTDQILIGESCIRWFEQKGFSVLQCQSPDLV